VLTIKLRPTTVPLQGHGLLTIKLPRIPVPLLFIQSTMFPSRNTAQKLPTTRTLKGQLACLALLYLSLAAFAAWLSARGGYSWDGDTEKLTTILAVLGVIFTFTARMLQSECQTARMQFLAGKAIKRSVSLRDIHEMDTAIRGGHFGSFSLSAWGLFYKALLPVLAIAMSAALKKTLTVDIEHVQQPVSAQDAVLTDPINTDSCRRAQTFPGAVMYNTTSVYNNYVDPTQTSWPYIIADKNGTTGIENITFHMPWWPALVAEGRSGYVNYTAEDVPRLSASVQCNVWNFDSTSTTLGALTSDTSHNPASINNGGNTVMYWAPEHNDLPSDTGPLAIAVLTEKGLAWNCTAEMSLSQGRISYVSDGNGNWNLTSIAPSYSTPINFETAVMTKKLASIIMSDILGSASTSTGWCWDYASINGTQLSQMLIATRLSFAASLLGITTNRYNLDSTASPPGVAYMLATKIKLLNGWGLSLTIALLGLQGALAFGHLVLPSHYRIDFGILQVMEMQQATHDDEYRRSVAPLLTGHCSKGSNAPKVDANVSIRFDETSNHLGIVKEGVEGSEKWKRITDQHVIE
jgi:hypothetical protein